MIHTPSENSKNTGTIGHVIAVDSADDIVSSVAGLLYLTLRCVMLSSFSSKREAV